MRVKPDQLALSMPQSILKSMSQRGFTLIEVVIGIVVFSISLAIISSLIIPAEEQSVDLTHQIEASELGQGLINEILSRAYDQNSDMSGGGLRCGEILASPCSVNLGPDAGETAREDYNDVDDYHGYSAKETATGSNLASGYNNFLVSVSVTYDGSAIGLANDLAKRITVTITTPMGTAIDFTAYKTNY